MRIRGVYVFSARQSIHRGVFHGPSIVMSMMMSEVYTKTSLARNGEQRGGHFSRQVEFNATDAVTARVETRGDGHVASLCPLCRAIVSHGIRSQDVAGARVPDVAGVDDARVDAFIGVEGNFDAHHFE